MSEAAFSPRTIAVAGTLGALSLFAGFAAVIFGGEVREVDSFGADAFSRSAIGHAAFAELLRRSGRQVVIDRRSAPGELGEDALLLVLEPSPFRPGDHGEHDDRVQRLLAAHPRVLVALPKRTGREDDDEPGWLHSSGLDTARPSQLLGELGVSNRVVRLEAPPAAWESDALEHAPELDQPQVAITAELEPVLWSGEHVLLGRLPATDGARHYVLTDPDPLSNHGLGRGENAALVLEMLALVAGPDAPVVIDEVVHGHALEPLVWTELGRFPLVLVLIHTLLVLAFLGWAASGRFGAPERAREGLEAGKRLLIDNTTSLLTSGGFAGSLLRRYLTQNERLVAARYHLPADLAPEERRARLAALRSAGPGLDEVRARVAAARGAGRGAEREVLEAARMVRRWREELLHGDR